MPKPKHHPSKDQNAKWYQNRKEVTFAKGLCYKCGRTKEPDQAKSWVCERCELKEREKRAARRKKRVDKGLCICCPESSPSPMVAGQYCQRHWFAEFAGDRLGQNARGKELQELFERQNRRCVYTGEELFPGINMSLDHKIPKSRGGTNDIGNLQWVTRQVNLAKTDFTHEELIAFCRRVSKRFEV